MKFHGTTRYACQALCGFRTGCLSGKRVPQLLVSSNISLKPPDITYIDMVPRCLFRVET
jgi:hypothetical protein